MNLMKRITKEAKVGISFTVAVITFLELSVAAKNTATAENLTLRRVRSMQKAQGGGLVL